MLEGVLARFAQQAPAAVMVRALLANVLSDRELDAIFRESAERQVEGPLLFSQVVGLLQLVVTQTHPSVHAAYQQRHEALQVSLAAVYDKLAGVELAVTRELVSRTATRMKAVLAELTPPRAPLPDYEVRILDGFHLAATEHRLEETRAVKGAPLPGQALVVLDPQRQVIEEVLPWEDGHTQERAILAELVDVLQAGQVWVCDRNFATRMWLFEIQLAEAFFVIRRHGQLPVETTGERTAAGTGAIFEQPARLPDGFGDELMLRQVVVQLAEPNTAGDRELTLLTNLPATVTAAQVAELYRTRWSIEQAFGELTLALNGEIKTLGYPKAALLGFALAVVTYNALRVVRAAVAAAQGAEVADQISPYYLANEVATIGEGLAIAVEESAWERFGQLAPPELAVELKQLAAHVQLRRYQKHARGPKRKPPPRSGKSPHVSTARLLKKRK